MPHSACPHQSVCSTAPTHFHAVASFSGLAALRALTINHRTAGLGTLTHHALGAEAASALHDELAAAGVESLVLTTCNRSELYWRARIPGDDETVMDAFGRAAGTATDALRLSGTTAARHLFRVCAGLESLVLGEAEILGQVRAALATNPGAGPFLRGVVQAALRAGRMARAETAIGVGAQSVASAAVQMMSGLVPLERSRVVVLGAGATGAKVARHLRALGVGCLVVANRTLGRAHSVAGTLGADAIGLEQVRDELDRADAVVSAVDAPAFVITQADLRESVARRGGRPLTIVDLSMPPSIEPGETPGVAHVNLAALQREVTRQRDRRAGEIPKVEAVLDRELRHLHSWARHQALRPLVADLRRKVEAIRHAELQRARDESSGGLDDAVLDRLSRRLLDQVLAIPLTALEAGDLPLDATQAQYLRRLFALGPGA